MYRESKMFVQTMKKTDDKEEKIINWP